MQDEKFVISVVEKYSLREGKRSLMLYPINKYGTIDIGIDSDEDTIVDRSQYYSLTVDDAKKVIDFLQNQIKDKI